MMILISLSSLDFFGVMRGWRGRRVGMCIYIYMQVVMLVGIFWLGSGFDLVYFDCDRCMNDI